MCTVTVNFQENGLLVAMNRDERLGRAPELPPSLHGGVRMWAAPLDGEKHGTWMGVNEEGVSACLLNGYQPGDLDLLFRDDIPSRGEIIPRLMAHSCREIEDLLRGGLNAERYPSFTLLVWTRNRSWEVRWRLNQGRTLKRIEPGWRMVSSSAWRTEEVLAWRKDRFQDWIDRGGSFDHSLPSFNLLEVEGKKQWSPWMTRSFSATRSVTLLEVDRPDDSANISWWSRADRGLVDPGKADESLRFPLRSSS